MKKYTSVISDNQTTKINLPSNSFFQKQTDNKKYEQLGQYLHYNLFKTIQTNDIVKAIIPGYNIVLFSYTTNSKIFK